MVTGDVVLRDLPFVLLCFLRQEVNGEAFLDQRIALVFLVSKHRLDGGYCPVSFAFRGRHAFIGEFLSDQGRCLTGKEIGVDTPHDLGFVFDDDDLPVSTPISGINPKNYLTPSPFPFFEAPR